MIMQSNQNLPSYNRQDSLLQRLKNCVGEIKSQLTPNQPKLNSTIKFSNFEVNIPKISTKKNQFQKVSSARFQGNLLLKKIQNENNTSYLTKREKKQQSLYEKPSKCVHEKYQYFDYNKNTSHHPKSKIQNEVIKNKNFCLGQLNQYALRPQNINTLNIVSESTKKRISERQSLINEEGLSQRLIFANKPKKQLVNEEKTRKNFINKSENHQNQKNNQSILNNQKLTYLNRCRHSQNEEIKEKSQKSEIKKVKLLNIFQPVEFDQKRIEKIQKLKKISEMNEEINKRIRKIVDTFEDYIIQKEN